MTTTLEETQEMVASAPPVRPMYPAGPARDQRLEHEPVALDAMMMGVTAAAAVLAGLALFTIPVAWAPSIAPAVRVLLMVIGGYLIALGLAYVASANPKVA